MPRSVDSYLPLADQRGNNYMNFLRSEQHLCRSTSKLIHEHSKTRVPRKGTSASEKKTVNLLVLTSIDLNCKQNQTCNGRFHRVPLRRYALLASTVLLSCEIAVDSNRLFMYNW